MKFEVEVAEKVRTISVKRHGQSFRIEEEGRVLIVDARRIGELALSLLVGGDNGPSTSLGAGPSTALGAGPSAPSATSRSAGCAIDCVRD